MKPGGWVVPWKRLFLPRDSEGSLSCQLGGRGQVLPALKAGAKARRSRDGEGETPAWWRSPFSLPHLN